MANGKRNNKKTILVIEDNPLNMKLVVDFLEHKGFSLLKATDGETAFKFLNKNIPDLIILDIRLPDIDGFTIFDTIRKDDNLKNIKVMAMTALAMSDDEQRLKEAGFDAYILKPIDIKEFIKLVTKLLNGP